MPLVFDADFFWYLTLPHAEKLRVAVLSHAKNCVLTPNKVEFARLAEYFTSPAPTKEGEETKETAESGVVSELSPELHPAIVALCKKMNGVTIIQKAWHDTVLINRE